MRGKTLTDAQILEIQRLYSAKNTRQTWTVATLANAFGVSKPRIRQIVADAPRGRGSEGLPRGGIEAGKLYADR